MPLSPWACLPVRATRGTSRAVSSVGFANCTRVPNSGWGLSRSSVRRVMREDIIDQVDHRFLNEDVPFLRDLPVTTTENLAVAFWEVLANREPEWGGAHLHRVRLMESTANFVDYYGPG